MHENAAGICISDPDQFISDMNETLKDVSSDIVYYVDYIFHNNNINPEIIFDLAAMNDYLGQDFGRPQIYIDEIDASTMQVMKSNTLKFTVDGVSIIMFGAEDELIEELSKPGVKLNVVCKCAINEWNGNLSPQLIIVDYEIIKTSGIDAWGF